MSYMKSDHVQAFTASQRTELRTKHRVTNLSQSQFDLVGDPGGAIVIRRHSHIVVAKHQILCLVVREPSHLRR